MIAAGVAALGFAIVLAVKLVRLDHNMTP